MGRDDKPTRPNGLADTFSLRPAMDRRFKMARRLRSSLTYANVMSTLAPPALKSRAPGLGEEHLERRQQPHPRLATLALEPLERGR